MSLTRERFVEQAMADFESPLIGYATTLLHDPELARDAVQDTFVRLCGQDPAKLQGGLKPWLFTVCRNRAFDMRRKDKRLQPMEDEDWRKVAAADLQPDEQADHRERFVWVMRLLHRLSENQREVIILKFQQGLSYGEIEKITGLTSSNIGFLIHTGLKRVRELLPDEMKSSHS